MARKPEALADPIDIAVGARIRLLRKVRGLSQQSLAEAAGVTFQQIQKYERGTNRISFSALVKIAGALGQTASELISHVDGSLPAEQTADTVELVALFEKVGSSDMREAVINLARAAAQKS